VTEKIKTSPSGESTNQNVFDIFDRASSHQANTAAAYFIGDGIVVRVGWVDNEKPEPDLTIELRDEKLEAGVSLVVGRETARYTRETKPAFTVAEWLADKEKRRQARQHHRRETFPIPTAALEPIARAVSSHDPHTEPEPADSERMYESALRVEPLASTDIEFIRELIHAWSMPLD